MPALINLVGQRFGRLVVTGRSISNSKRTVWRCACECGKVHTSCTGNLKSGNTQSCGCYQKTRASESNTVHGHAKGYKNSPQLKLLRSAKQRATRFGLEFDLEIADIVIPEVCPLLGIALIGNKATMGDGSPSLDRKDSECGYTKDNVWVISMKANRIKNNSTFQELRSIVSNLERLLCQKDS